MSPDVYDWKRDDGLDFPPDDASGEPDTGEVKDDAYRCDVDESAGMSDRLSGMRDA